MILFDYDLDDLEEWDRDAVLDVYACRKVILDDDLPEEDESFDRWLYSMMD